MNETNAISLISGNIDLIGRNFAGATYSAFSIYLTPILTSFLILYFIFWGFRFWQGRADGDIADIAFRLVRVAAIVAVVSGWGPFQQRAYQALVTTPAAVTRIMLNNVVDPGRGSMSTGTMERDLGDFYNFALIASVRIEAFSKNAPMVIAAAPPAPGTAAVQSGTQAEDMATATGKSPLDIKLSSSGSAAIVWIAAALFVGCATFLMVFAKVSLLVLLALGPIFIVALLFDASSRFFIGWLIATIQIMFVPILLYVLLAFFLIAVKPVVIDLSKNMDNGEIPMMKFVGPFVFVSFAGLFLLSQVISLSVRIGSGSVGVAVRAFTMASGLKRNIANQVNLARSVNRNGGGQSNTANYAGSSTQRNSISASGSDNGDAAFHDYLSAVNRQQRNR